jgi:hypothetical protein
MKHGSVAMIEKAISKDLLMRPSEERRYLRYISFCEVYESMAAEDSLLGAILGEIRSGAFAPEVKPGGYVYYSGRLYISFQHFPSDDEYSEAMSKVRHNEMVRHEKALSKLLNSLSQEQEVSRPVQLTLDALPAGCLYRINLQAYGWSTDLWARIAAEDRYSRANCQDMGWGSIRASTACEVPCIRGDWLLYTASRAPWYEATLKLPRTARELERRLGVDVEADIRSGRAYRAGVVASEVSPNNRLLERHELGAYTGYYWKSYDFKDNIPSHRKDLRSTPYGPGTGPGRFVHDANEIIFSLPNGLQAYMITNAVGERLETAPIEIVSDTFRRDHIVRTAVSCIRCHEAGLMPLDYIWSAALKRNVRRPRLVDRIAADRKDRIKSLYRSSDEMAAIVRLDSGRFLDAMAESGYRFDEEDYGEPIESCVARFETDLALPNAAGELGVSSGALSQVLEERGAPLENIAGLRFETSRRADVSPGTIAFRDGTIEVTFSTSEGQEKANTSVSVSLTGTRVIKRAVFEESYANILRVVRQTQGGSR